MSVSPLIAQQSFCDNNIGTKPNDHVRLRARGFSKVLSSLSTRQEPVFWFFRFGQSSPVSVRPTSGRETIVRMIRRSAHVRRVFVFARRAVSADPPPTSAIKSQRLARNRVVLHRCCNASRRRRCDP